MTALYILKLIAGSVILMIMQMCLLQTAGHCIAAHTKKRLQFFWGAAMQMH